MNFPKALKLIFLGLITVYLYSCSYDFSEDNHVDIKIPQVKNNSIKILDFKNNDTINEKRNIEYIFISEEDQIALESEVFIDNEKIYSTYNKNEGMFSISPSKYKDGKHVIKIKQKFTSGSGSINDQLQQEILTTEEQFNFIVKRNPSTPPSINSVIIENGSITINWSNINEENYDEAFLNLRFKNREVKIPLTKQSLNLKKFIDKTTVLFEGNSNSLYYDLNSEVTYSIIYTNKYTELHGASKTLKYNPNWLNIKLAYINNNNYKIKWDKYPLYNNFNEFNISHGGVTFKGTSSGGEHIVNKSYIIGKEYNCLIKPYVDNSYYVSKTIWDINLDQNTFGLFNHNNLYSLGIVFNPSTQKYYALIGEDKVGSKINYSLYEYSTNMELLRKKSIIQNATVDNYTFSKKSLHLNTYTNNFHVETREGTYVIDKNSLEATLNYSNQTDISKRHMVRGNILLSKSLNGGAIEVKNIQNNKTIYSNSSSQVWAFLSNDGKYIQISDYTTHEGTIYKIINDSLEKVYDITSYRVEFYKNKAFYQNKGEVFIIDLETNSTSSFIFGTEPKIQFDTQSQKVLVQQNGYNGIYDLSTKSLKTFNSEDDKNGQYPFGNEDRDYRLHLENNRLIHTKGIYIDNY